MQEEPYVSIAYADVCWRLLKRLYTLTYADEPYVSAAYADVC
jgi:hypothetical protein